MYSSFSRLWPCKVCFTGRFCHFCMLIMCKMVSPVSMGAGWVWLRWLTDPWLVPADRRGSAGLETSCGSWGCCYRKKSPVADVDVIGFKQALLLFLCRRKLHQKHGWNSSLILGNACGIQACSKRREQLAFQAFPSYHPVQRVVCCTSMSKFLKLGWDFRWLLSCFWCCFLCLPVAI